MKLFSILPIILAITSGQPELRYSADGDLLSMTPAQSVSDQLGCVSRLQFFSNAGVLIGALWGTNIMAPESFRLTSTVLPLQAVTPSVTVTPQLKPVALSIDPYEVPPGASNAVLTVYKSTALTTNLFTPFKPTAIFPASRAAFSILVLPGRYRLYVTAKADPYAESQPSNTVEITVTP